MQEEDIIFGGEKKLAQAIQEAYDLFHPKAIAIFSTCPVGLIGDDVHAVAREMKEKLGHQRLRLQLRRLQGREPVGRPPHRQQPGVQARGRALTTTPARRQVHASTCWASTTSAATPSRSSASLEKCGITVIATFSRQLHLRPVRQRPHGRPELRHVPPLHQLRGRHDGEEVRHPLDQGELHRRRRHGQVAAQDRRSTSGTQELIDRVEEVIAEEMAAVESAAGDDQAPHRGQDGHALRRRLAGPTTTRISSTRSA